MSLLLKLVLFVNHRNSAQVICLDFFIVYYVLYVCIVVLFFHCSIHCLINSNLCACDTFIERLLTYLLTYLNCRLQSVCPSQLSRHDILVAY